MEISTSLHGKIKLVTGKEARISSDKRVRPGKYANVFCGICARKCHGGLRKYQIDDHGYGSDDETFPYDIEKMPFIPLSIAYQDNYIDVIQTGAAPRNYNKEDLKNKFDHRLQNWDEVFHKKCLILYPSQSQCQRCQKMDQMPASTGNIR